MKQLKSIIMILVIAFLIGAGFAVRAKNANYASAQAHSLAATYPSTATTAQLNALKKYVATHSGATVTVQLTSAYNQAAQAAQAAETTPSSSLYAAAQAACAGHAISTVQAQCNEQYLESHSTPVSASPTIVQPKLADYTYHYVAPFLTWDVATALWAVAFILIIVLALPLLRPQPHF